MMKLEPLQQAIDEDRRLVDRCLARDTGAWDDLYRRCHVPLVSIVRLLLGVRSADIDLVDEITARVWFAVVKEDGRLLDRYDTARGCRLTTFLAALARTEVLQHFRSERRRKVRERAVSQSETKQTDLSVTQANLLIEEFIGTLTPREQEFLATQLLSGDHAECGEFSRANAWQLRSRVRRKLSGFLDEGGSQAEVG